MSARHWPRRAVLTAPLARPALAQRRGRLVIAVLSLAEHDPEAAPRLAASRAGLPEGDDVSLGVRWTGGGPDRVQGIAAEVVAARPDLIIVNGGTAIAAILRQTRSIPVVFQYTSDPVAAGIVPQLARPGGNVTGFTSYAPGMPYKWLDLLRQLRPEMRRVCLLVADNPSARIFPTGGLPGLATIALPIADDADVERAFRSIGQAGDAGLMVVPSSVATTRRGLITRLAREARLPAVYAQISFVEVGGLLSYGVNLAEQFRDVAGYGARILAGARPGDLPVQAPTRFELAINLGTARAIGLEIPTPLLAAADVLLD